MKINSRLKSLALILAFCMICPFSSVQALAPTEEQQPVISLDFQDANLKDVLKVFSIQSGMNFVASEAIQDRKITLYLDKVPVKDAMEKIFKANNISFDLDKEANIFIVKDLGKPKAETVTRIYQLKFATVSTSALSDAQSGVTAGSGTSSSSTSSSSSTTDDEGNLGDMIFSVNKILTDNGKVTEDKRTNSLIITDVPTNFERIEQLIAMLDVQQPQVMLEVEMLDVSKALTDKIGLKFDDPSFAMTLSPAKLTNKFPFYPDQMFSPTSGGNLLTAGSVQFSSLKLVFDFLSRQTDTRYLARPRILTLNNQTAEIKIATDEVVGLKAITQSSEGSSTLTSEAERAETGVILNVTPQINSDTDTITMYVYPQVKSATLSVITGADGQQFQDVEERSTKSIISMKDGETIILGGLIRNEKSTTVQKIPLLSDIPLLGKMFTHTHREKDKQRELLVFITPRIVKNSVQLAKVAQAPVLPVREQAASGSVERQTAINSALSGFDKKK